MTAREFAKVEKRLGAIEQAILELAEALRRPDAPPGGVVLPSTPVEDASGRQNAPAFRAGWQDLPDEPG